jgi:hypothetical protein
MSNGSGNSNFGSLLGSNNSITDKNPKPMITDQGPSPTTANDEFSR